MRTNKTTKIASVLAELERLSEFQKRNQRSFSKGNHKISIESGDLSRVSAKDMAEFYTKIWCSFNKYFRGVLARKNRT